MQGLLIDLRGARFNKRRTRCQDRRETSWNDPVLAIRTRRASEPAGQAYLKDIQRIFADLNHATERHRHRRKTPLLKLVAIEVVAEKWLMPQLAHFKTLHPDIVIEFEVDHGEVDPDRRDFDVWIAFADEVPDTVLSEKLLEETLFPVCSPSLLQARGRPRKPKDLHAWPLVYDLHWTTDWSHWFAHHGVASADLSQASGFVSTQWWFRLRSTVSAWLSATH